MQAAGLITNVKTIGERLKWAREQRKMTQAQLAKAAGVSTSTIGNLEAGIRGKPRELNAIANAVMVNAPWLEEGLGGWDVDIVYDGPMFSRAVRAYGAGNVDPAPVAPNDLVPVISWVQAGSWSQIHDNFQPGDADEWMPCPVRHGPNTYALRVRGSSMFNPGGDISFKDGDTIFVDPAREARHRSLVIVRMDDEKDATFKQLLIEGDERMLQALNPNWPERIMRINGHATICGVVIGKLESFV